MDEALYIGTNGHVAAIATSDGAELWRTKLGEGVFSAPGMQDVCVLQHGNLIFAGCYGHLFCLDAITGKTLWKNGLTGLGHNDVTLAIGGQSVQFVASHTHSKSRS